MMLARAIRELLHGAVSLLVAAIGLPAAILRHLLETEEDLRWERKFYKRRRGE